MTRPRLTPPRVRLLAAALAALAFAACQQRMAHPPEYRPLQETSFFADRRSSRPLEEGVVHRGQILDDDPLASGLTPQGKQPQTVTILNDDGTPKEIRTGAGIPNRLENFVTTFPYASSIEAFMVNAELTLTVAGGCCVITSCVAAAGVTVMAFVMPCPSPGVVVVSV